MSEDLKNNVSNALLNLLKEQFPEGITDNADPLKIWHYIECLLDRDPASFGANLRTLRQRAGIRQEELAQALKVSQVSISMYEQGRRSPKDATFFKMAEVFGIDPVELLSYELDDAPESPLTLPTVSKINFFNADPDFMDGVYKDGTSIKFFKDFHKHNYDFAFKVSDSSMEGVSHSIPNGSYALCSTKTIQDYIKEIKNHSEKGFDLRYLPSLKLLNGKICVVTLPGSPAMLREVYFDENFLTLIPWNDHEKLYRLPFNKHKEEPTATLDDMCYKGSQVCATQVKIFGVVKRVMFDLE